MNREGIRRLAAEELGVATSPYRFADTEDDYKAAIEEVGLPCVVKPIMSSSGKGQSLVKTPDDVDGAWIVPERPFPISKMLACEVCAMTSCVQ